MPLYDFHCNACNKTSEIFKKIANKDEPLQEPCPLCGAIGSMTTVLSAPMLVDPYRLGRMPVNTQLQEKFSEIHSKNHGSVLDKASTITKI